MVLIPIAVTAFTFGCAVLCDPEEDFHNIGLMGIAFLVSSGTWITYLEMI